MRSAPAHALTLAALAALWVGCSSTPASSSAVDDAPKEGDQDFERIGPEEPEPYDPELARDQRETGMVLADIDRSLQTWNNIVLQGRADRDGARLNIVEGAIRHSVNEKLAIVIEQLEVGPTSNRTIAAAALGFSASSRALGPLLAALDDPESDVVANALLGLSLLDDSETPLVPIAARLEATDQPLNVRSNAGRALRTLSNSDLVDEERDAVVRAARAALSDPEPALRVHGALLLAEALDTESLDELTRALGDEAPIVARAASRSLARIGSVESEYEGRIVRALVASYVREEEDDIKDAVLEDLTALTRRNYGDDEEEWVRYAQRLP